MTTILIVDDSQTQRHILSDLLGQHKFTIWTAANGLEAIKQIRQQSPDLIVLDLIMPQLNGYELCRLLKTNPSTRDIPIIICSAKGTNVDRYWGLKQGADAYIAKPFHAHELVETIQQLLAESSSMGLLGG
ncbi:response regulator [Spirulina subsalsa FACHB-351]|uniref:Response regulator n=1 Tax=Spirulina subsalsa FACHB-351 TaxID=234711 RepID=A0ABT3LA29_9CYAN|nr:response regulator [Spirulina subsalsa]MCW6038362.1 response regulator [Spirulina subsalsa FACHB-351]